MILKGEMLCYIRHNSLWCVRGGGVAVGGEDDFFFRAPDVDFSFFRFIEDDGKGSKSHGVQI